MRMLIEPGRIDAIDARFRRLSEKFDPRTLDARIVLCSLLISAAVASERQQRDVVTLLETFAPSDDVVHDRRQ